METMVGYFGHDTKRINHALKVFAFSRIISSRETPDAGMQEIIAYTALLHDVGILKAEQKYKSSSGKYQQIERPPIARLILTNLGIPAPVIDRVCFITGNHHTDTKIDGIDFQIIVEADYFGNIFEDDLERGASESIGVRIFKTETGKNLLRTMYLD